MRRVLATAAGLAAGSALALVLLYVNPLTAQRTPAPSSDNRSLSYVLPLDALLVSHAGRMRLPVTPAGTDRLWERTVRRSLLKAVVLGDEEGEPVGVASRVSVPSADSNLLRRGLIVNDYWLVTLPGEGTLAVLADTNVWPLLKDAALPVWYLGREWNGPATYHLTAGPAGSGFARVHGVNGSFAGVHGRAWEQYELRGVDASGVELWGGLHLRVVEAEPASEE